MKLLTLALLFASTAPGAAFLTPISSTRAGSAIVGATKLNDIDEMCIENVAELCLRAEESLAEECDLEEHQALVNQLEIQKDLLQQHLDHMDNLLHRLKNDGLAKQEPETTYFAG